MRRILAFLFCSTLLAAANVHGGTMIESKASEPCPPDPRLVLDFGSSYVFESDFDRGDNANGDAWSKNFRLGYRIPFDGPQWINMDCSQWYVRLGLDYQRFDFSNSGGLPIPNTLQNVAAVVAVEFLVHGRPAIFLEALPGVYFEHDIDTDTFDVPARAASAFKVMDNVYGLIGVSYSGFRKYPVLPFAGVQWMINDQWTLSLMPPNPRLIYSPAPEWEYWVGGEIVDGAFRTDARKVDRKEKLNDAVLTYSEYRAGLGFTYTSPAWRLEVGAGYAFQRKFDYHRAEEGFKTDEGAPYVRVELRTNF